MTNRAPGSAPQQQDEHRTGCGCASCGPPRGYGLDTPGDLEAEALKDALRDAVELNRRAAQVLELMLRAPATVPVAGVLGLVEKLRATR